MLAIVIIILVSKEEFGTCTYKTDVNVFMSFIHKIAYWYIDQR